MFSRLKPLLFHLDPERAHDLVLAVLRVAGNLTPVRKFLCRLYRPQRSRSVECAGVAFPNPVGLAAGYDKNGVSWRGLSCLGFGHLELGTVTPRPQSGNPKPRIFRFPDQEGVINHMGFPGRGLEFISTRIPPPGSSPERDRIVLGINIGKNKDTPNQQAAEDYLVCLRTLSNQADYFAVNVSSPNTIGLRKLQGKRYLSNLLQVLVAERDLLQLDLDRPLPLFVKLSPDLSDSELDDALEAVTGSSANGVIATNTTVQREYLLPSDPGISGGLSGKPIKDLSTSMIAKIHRRTAGKLPIIGVGGISSVEDAQEKLDAGADLVQVYSGLIFKGPGLIRELVENV